MNTERWFPIIDWPGYKVSDWGRVHSYWGAGGRGGHGRRSIGLTPKLLKGSPHARGHLTVVLYRNQSREKRTAYIHTLVLEAFVGPCPAGMEACHAPDPNPTNNRLDNLRWDTPTENQIDRLRHGTMSTAKLAEADILAIAVRLIAGDSGRAIARDHGVSEGTISCIRSGSTWTHVTSHIPGWPFGSKDDRIAADPVYIPAELARTLREIWRPVVGYLAYRVSNRGRVQGCWEKVIGGTRGQMRLGRTWTDRVVLPNRDGHYILGLSDGDGKRKTVYLHHLVLEAFACPRPPGMKGCHNDGNPANNDAGNLRWDTTASNARDRIRHKGAKKAAV